MSKTRNDSFLKGCVRRFRESGEGLIMDDQSISSIDETIKAKHLSKVSTSSIKCKRY